MPNQTSRQLSEHRKRLIGREQEIAEVNHLLADPQCRLLTLVGPGGTGKTQLAIEIAAHLTRFADGNFFVALQSIESTDELVRAIAAAIALPLAGNDPLPIQLRNILSGKQLLLVLDNFEQLLASVDLLTDLLDSAPDLKVLVTSREAVGISEEWQYVVRGLAVPPHDADDNLAAYGAVQLFQARARQVRHDFRWEDEREAVAAICRQVEGNPLAMELAASWIAVLTCREIAAQIRQGLDILASSLRNMPARHRNMRVVFDHSWRLLEEEQRTIFEKLVVFRDGFTRQAASAVAGASLADLPVLVAKSLIRREPDGRYQIHELLRQYGTEKLAASPAQETDAHRAHASYYLAFLRERRSWLDGSEQLKAYQEIAAEDANVFAALRWSVATFQSREEVDAIRRALSPLTSYVQMCGHYLTGADLFLEIIRVLEDDARRELCAPALAECLACFGWLAIRLGRTAAAEQALARSLQLYADFQLPLPEYQSQHPNVPAIFLALVQGEYERAITLGWELVQQAQQRNQPSPLALAYYALASAALAQGNYEQAYQFGQQALAIAESLGILFLPQHVHGVLGQIASIRGDLQAARRRFEAAYAICAAMDAFGGMAAHLKNLGDVATLQQLWSEAQKLYQQSLEHYQRVGDRGGAALAARGLATAAYHIDDLNGACHHFRLALETATATQSLPNLLTVLAAIGTFLVERPASTAWRSLGLATLRAVVEHPLCDLPTRAEAEQRLRSSAIPANLQSYNALEQLVATLQAELAGAAETSAPVGLASKRTTLPVEPLTPREVEVLALLAAGCSNDVIAAKLVVATGTVKAHTSNIYRKLDVTTRTQAIARAVELHLLH